MDRSGASLKLALQIQSCFNVILKIPQGQKTDAKSTPSCSGALGSYSLVGSCRSIDWQTKSAMDVDGMKHDPGLRAWVGCFWKKVPAGSAGI
jgi:hypothetical protein